MLRLEGYKRGFATRSRRSFIRTYFVSLSLFLSRALYYSFFLCDSIHRRASLYGRNRHVCFRRLRRNGVVISLSIRSAGVKEG